MLERKRMVKPNEKDIEKTSDGFYYLDCDGRHEPSWHKYLYYTKKEVIKLWRIDHPTERKVNG